VLVLFGAAPSSMTRIPWMITMVMSSARLRTAAFAFMFPMCSLTVSGLIPSVRAAAFLAGVPGRDRGQDADLAFRQVGAVTAAPAVMRAFVVGSHVVLLIAQAMALMLSPSMTPPVVNVRLAIDHLVRTQIPTKDWDISEYAPEGSRVKMLSRLSSS
jgi:hypothetical protein